MTWYPTKFRETVSKFRIVRIDKIDSDPTFDIEQYKEFVEKNVTTMDWQVIKSFSSYDDAQKHIAKIKNLGGLSKRTVVDTFEIVRNDN